MNLLFLFLFVVMTVLHLYASLKNNQYFRGITKSTLLILLLAFYVTSVSDPMLLLVGALLFSWMGDLFLLGKGLKFFSAGGITFGISHLLFAATYAQLFSFSDVPLFLVILLAAAFVAAVVIIFSKLKPHLPSKITIPMFLYLLANGCMNCFALYRLIAFPSLGAIITAVGALLFFVSDTALFFVRFNKNSVMKSHFLVMLTYSIAELFIVVGLILV